MEIEKVNKAEKKDKVEQIDKTALKKVIKEILLEDKDIIKDVIKEIINEKPLETEEERLKRMEELINKDFDKYDAVFKALA